MRSPAVVVGALIPSEVSLNQPWRLILPGAFDGPGNMAIDEALLTLVADGHSPPTLRFYEWLEPWVSLGSGQSASDLDPIRLAERKLATVRRASGGTAVYHQGQLGYAIVTQNGDPIWEGDLISSYARLSVPFRLAFERLGAVVEAAPGSASERFVAGAPPLAEKACFGALGPSEIVASGRKIIGNSQIRRRLAALQHGVIQVSGGQTQLAEIVATDSHEERQQLASFLANHVWSVAAAVGHSVSVRSLCDAIVAALAEALGIQIEPGFLHDRERRLAEELIDTKYASPAWTYRR